jgi:Beta/Gamma crystallin
MKGVSTMNEIRPYSTAEMSRVTQLLGAVPDLTQSVPWPEKHSGDVGQKKDTVKVVRPAEANWRMPEVVIFEHINYGGAEWRTNLNYSYVGGYWNDRVSSIVVVSGTWRFYQHANFQGAYWDLPQGWYHWVEARLIPNDMISSFQVIAY